MYAKAHKGVWPPNLSALRELDVDDEDLKNPKHPEAAIGWTYVPPKQALSQLRSPKDTVLIHESFTEWSDGVIVAFADGHAEFVRDQAKFQQMLAR